MRRWILYLWCLLALGSAAARGTPGALAVATDDSYLLAPGFMFLEDKEGKLTLDEILQPETQAAFRPVPPIGPGANFGLTRSAFWLRIDLKTSLGAPADWLLEVAHPPLDSLQLYSPDAAFGMKRQLAGDALPFASRAVAHRNHVLAVRLVPGSLNTLYLRVESQGTLSVPARLWRPDALWKHDQASYAALSLYFGLLAGLLLYNLLLFASVRDVAYLIYVAFAGSMALGQAALTGLGAQFLWPQWTWWNSVSPPVGMSAAAIFGLLFTRSFLSSASRMPSTDRFMLLQLAGWGLTLLAALTLPYAVSSWMVTVLAVLSVVTMVAVSVISIRRGYPGAHYFFIAWASLLLGVGTLTLHNIGALPSNAFTSNALLIGSALEMVLLSFALADRINVARRFKEQAQARIAAEHAMVEALSQSQGRLRSVLEERETILESSMVGIAFLTTQGRFRWANQAMLDIFGFEDRPSTSMEPCYISREQYLRVGAEVAASVARGEVYETELQMRRNDGTLIWVSLSGKAVGIRPHDPDSGMIWTFLDVTERKKSEAGIRGALEQQKTLNELRNRFVAMTSHEFRTPLAAILSAEELLRHYGDRLPQPERIEILDGIAAGVKRMSRMIDRVLLLGKADAGMLDFKPQRIKLAPLCRQFIEDARAQQPRDRSHVTLEIGDQVGEGAYDEKLLRHIFSNLLSNALKYSPGGGQVRFKVRREEASTVFEVADQGIGIPTNEIPHLFEPFHRASNVGEIQGTGLGLAIVKSAVEMHGGTIQVSSVAGEGTAFTVCLPA